MIPKISLRINHLNEELWTTYNMIGSNSNKKNEFFLWNFRMSTSSWLTICKLSIVPWIIMYDLKIVSGSGKKKGFPDAFLKVISRRLNSYFTSYFLQLDVTLFCTTDLFNVVILRHRHIERLDVPMFWVSDPFGIVIMCRAITHYKLLKIHQVSFSFQI